MKKTLKATTPAGEFSRETATAYAFVVVRKSPRAAAFVESANSGAQVYRGGVNGRWLKDRGYAVTWHGSEKAAKAAAGKPYDWDSKTELVGVFPVSECPA
jgi:hypothetical protein